MLINAGGKQNEIWCLKKVSSRFSCFWAKTISFIFFLKREILLIQLLIEIHNQNKKC